MSASFDKTEETKTFMATAPIDVGAEIDRLAATVFERMEERAEMLRVLKAWEHWYSEDSSEFNRDSAREDGLRAIARAEGK